MASKGKAIRHTEKPTSLKDSLHLHVSILCPNGGVLNIPFCGGHITYKLRIMK